jgi:uncharacterized membrane protein
VSKTSIVVIVEMSMLVGIAVIAVVLPRSTPLSTFIFASASAFIVGNYLLFQNIRRIGKSKPPDRPHTPSLGYAMLLLAGWWILWFVVRRLMH